MSSAPAEIVTFYNARTRRIVSSAVRLPFVARLDGQIVARRRSLAAILAVAPAGAALFFDYALDCGTYIGRAGEVAEDAAFAAA